MFSVAAEGAEAGTADRQHKAQFILNFVSFRVPVQGTRNDTNLNTIHYVFGRPCRGGGRHCRQAEQDTIVIEICVIASLVQSGVTTAIMKGTRNDKHLNDILHVLSCPRRDRGKYCRQAAQKTKHVKICVIASLL